MDDLSPARRRRRAVPPFARGASPEPAGRAAPAAVRRLRAAGALSAAAVVALPGAAAAGTASGSAAAPPAWCAAHGALTAQAMPHTIDIAECDLRGRVVRGAGGLSATVPRDGTSVSAYSLRTDGAAELRVEVDDRAGEINISTRSVHAPQGRPRRLQAPIDACRDGRFRTQPSKWPKGATVEWRYHSGGTGRPDTAIAAGVAGAFDARTDCGGDQRFDPPPNVYEKYAGAAAQPPNLTDAAACGTRDGDNTFGRLAMGRAERDVLAATCSWSAGPTTVETDMALQTQGREWWSGEGTCPAGAFATTAVATHEAGHVLGLSHVGGAAHSNLTMAPSIGPCDNGPSTLGKGDYDGLIALYGPRPAV